MRKVTLASVLTMLLLLLTLTAMAEPAALDLSGHSFEDLAELTELLDQQEKTGTIVLGGGVRCLLQSAGRCWPVILRCTLSGRWICGA